MLNTPGAYALAAYEFIPQLEAVAKLEQYDPDDDIANDLDGRIFNHYAQGHVHDLNSGPVKTKFLSHSRNSVD